MNTYNKNVGYQLHLDPLYNPTTGGGILESSICYNGGNSSNFSNRISPLVYLFYVNSLFSPGGSDVSSNSVKNYIYDYLGGSFLDIKDDLISTSDLVTDSVDTGRKRGYNLLEIDVDDTFDMLSYDSTNPSWWKRMGDFGLTWGKKLETGDDYYNIAPIYEVKASDLVGTNSVVSERLLIDINDVNQLKNYYAIATQKGEKVILFRYALTDYYSKYLDVVIEDKFLFFDTYKKDIAYLSQETLFFDFDIIQLTFNKEETYTVIPAVSSPIDIINDITSPLQIPGFLGLPKVDWGKVIGIILLILAFVVLLPFLPNIIRLIIKIIILPFKLIGNAFKGVKNNLHRGDKNV